MSVAQFITSVHLFFFLSLLICASLSDGATASSKRPSGLVLKVTRESKTLQYVTEIEQGMPLQKELLTVDLGGDQVWMQCDQTGAYNSSMLRPLGCPSALCSAAGGWCDNRTCSASSFDSIARDSWSGHVVEDVLSLSSSLKLPRFTFTCAPADLLYGVFPPRVFGMAGLGYTQLALPSLFLAAFSNFPRTFVVCLPSSTAPGALFFGKVPYAFFRGNKDVSQRLTYTPFVDSQYSISVTTIQVGHQNSVAINSPKLKIGGNTVLTTTLKYTTIERSVYSAIRDAFMKEAEAMSISRVAAVTPFDACFDATTVKSTRVGPGVPPIDLVLQYNNKTVWRIMGANLMVMVSKGVMCLALVEAEEWRRSYTIMIGGHQMQDNLLHFDLATSRLGFSNTLLGANTTCSNFKF